MKVNTKIDCLCGMETRVEIRKPDYFSHSVGTYYCKDGCGSKLQYKASKSKNKGHVSVQTRVVDYSDELNLLLMEKITSGIESNNNSEEVNI